MKGWAYPHKFRQADGFPCPRLVPGAGGVRLAGLPPSSLARPLAQTVQRFGLGRLKVRDRQPPYIWNRCVHSTQLSDPSRYRSRFQIGTRCLISSMIQAEAW